MGRRISFRALPVAELAAEDCALFLWATDTMLPEAIELMTAWGFQYSRTKLPSRQLGWSREAAG